MRLIRTIIAALFAVMCAASAEAGSRIKDIADFEGVRDNMLVGYGLVVGLAGTGDSLRNAPFTRQSLEGMLERLGINVRGTNMQTNNVAAVMVTAALPPCARHGARVDVAVSALGDAKSLQGGTLLVTPLMGADGEVYAVAQGPVAIGGFTASGQGQSVTKGTPTAAKIPSGAIVEREVGFELATLQVMRIGLRNPDFTTASRIAQAINRRLGGARERSLDRGAGAGRQWRRRRGLAADRVRAAHRRAGPAGTRGDRREVRNRGDRQGCARRHRGDRPGQPHDQDHRDAAGVAAAAVQPGRHDAGGAAHQHRGRRGPGQEARRAEQGRRQPAGPGRRAECARRHAARLDHDPADDQGSRRVQAEVELR
jgi:hypothetical protein